MNQDLERIIHKRKLKFILLLPVLILLTSCEEEEVSSEKRTFETSFEQVEDFSDFYITPQGYLNTSFHEKNDSLAHSGTYSHKAWITGTNEASTILKNNNHRAYPTVQLYKTEKGSFKTPCYITFWVWLDMELKQNFNGVENDWFSFATFTSDETDNWSRTVLVNLSYDGYLHLMHVPSQGEQDYIFQTKEILFPQKQWVEIKVYLDFSDNGYAKVWQNGALVSHAKVEDVENRLAQAHFGLYCPPQISTGAIYNDDLLIEMVDNE